MIEMSLLPTSVTTAAQPRRPRTVCRAVETAVAVCAELECPALAEADTDVDAVPGASSSMRPLSGEPPGQFVLARPSCADTYG